MQRKGFFKPAGAMLPAVAIALAAGGCSGDDARPAGSSHPAAAAVRELQDAFADEDAKRICDGMTRDARAQAAQVAQQTPPACERDVSRVFRIIAEGRWGDGEQPVVSHVRASRRQATATIEDEKGWRADVALAREAGTWKLSGFVGLPHRQLEELEDHLRSSPFPAPGRTPSEAHTSSGEPCPRAHVREQIAVTGGCWFRVSGSSIPIRVLTPFGRFKISDCSVRYRVTVGPGARTWTTDVRFANPFEHGCAEIVPCLTEEVHFRPWTGRLEANRGPGSGYTHRMLICLRTHIGMFGGELVMHLARSGVGWRATPTARGRTGFKIDGELALSHDDFYLQSR